MILLYSILVFSVINLSCQELLTTSNVPDTSSLQKDSRAVSSDEIASLKLQISQLNAKFEHQNSRLVKQHITIVEQNTKIKDLKNNMEKERKIINSTFKGAGSVFTRWGRRDCPSIISQLVYSGRTGGSAYLSPGGAAEYVCLPPDPIWNSNKYHIGTEWGYMYGARYQTIPKTTMNHKPVPCAVCRTSQFSTVLMIPARAECYQGWQKAYHGELVSGRHDHPAASQYVCLDADPQTSGTDTYNGKLMYSVKVQCGSLPCPPYENNTLLTCVVCLK